MGCLRGYVVQEMSLKEGASEIRFHLSDRRGSQAQSEEGTSLRSHRKLVGLGRL